VKSPVPSTGLPANRYFFRQEKQANNDKLQASVATYFRCGGVINSQIKKGLLLSLSVDIFFNQ